MGKLHQQSHEQGDDRANVHYFIKINLVLEYSKFNSAYMLGGVEGFHQQPGICRTISTLPKSGVLPRYQGIQSNTGDGGSLVAHGMGRFMLEKFRKRSMVAAELGIRGDSGDKRLGTIHEPLGLENHHQLLRSLTDLKNSSTSTPKI